MLDFVITNYLLFIIIAVVLLLGLFGYMMDRKKYNDYRKEILESDKELELLNSKPEISNVATPLSVDKMEEKN